MDPRGLRLVTKPDFDGMVCGILLKGAGCVERVAFAHPKDVESGRFEITAQDITAGLPYREAAHLAFDHYPGAASSAGPDNLKVDPSVPSTSRVIYGHFGKERFAGVSEDILEAVDKGFSARLSVEDILYPTGWVLLSYLIDHRTGLEGAKRFRKTHDELILELMEEGSRRSIWEILSLPDVEERLELYFSCVEEYKEQILRCSSIFSNLVATDTRKEKVLYPGNKFMTYALFPECNVSLAVSSAEEGGWASFAAGRSVLDRSCSLDIGRLMRKYGGGGHPGAGSCRARDERSEAVKKGLIEDLRYGFFKNLLMGYFNYY